MTSQKKLYFTAEELLNRKIEEIPTLWDPFFPKIGIVGLTGSSDVGKSTLLREFSMAVCMGQPTFLGYPLNVKHRSVIYISTEDSEEALCACLHKQIGTVNPKEIQGLKFIFNQDNPIKTACKLFETQKADALIIDAWADLFVGNTNDVSQTRNALNELNKIALKNECLLIILHHTVKNSEYYKPDKNKLNGSQGIEAKLRALLELRPWNAKERVLSILKGNYMSSEMKETSIVLRFDEKRLLFMPTGESLDKNSVGGECTRRTFSKDIPLARRIKELKDTRGLSFPKIQELLENENPGANSPSLTTVKTLYQSVSQKAA